MTVIAGQLAFDFPAPDDLSDLDWAAERLLQLERDADLAAAPPRPACVCLGGPLVFRDDFGDDRCLTCGRSPR